MFKCDICEEIKDEIAVVLVDIDNIEVNKVFGVCKNCHGHLKREGINFSMVSILKEKDSEKKYLN